MGERMAVSLRRPTGRKQSPRANQGFVAAFPAEKAGAHPAMDET